MAEGAVQIAQKSSRRERAGLFEAGTAVWEAFYGNAAAARQSATRALELGRGGREVDYAAAFALALAGDLPQSRALAEDLAREFPEDTSVQFMYLPTLRALFSLNAHDPAAAIQALQTASRYDLALGAIGFIGRFGGLYPIYVRGLAYLAARQPAEAAGEFQRILDHRSIVLVDPMDALTRLQLARALALSSTAYGAGEGRQRGARCAVDEHRRQDRWLGKRIRNTPTACTRAAATTEPCERPGDSGRGRCRRARTRNSDCPSDCYPSGTLGARRGW
jgi:hypothetical protein